MAQPVDYVAFITSLATSILGGYLAREFLFGISNQRSLWIILFLIVNIYLILLISARNHLYDEVNRKTLWWQSRQNFLQFLYSVVIFTVMQMFIEVTFYVLEISPLCLNDFLNFGNFGIFLIFVLILKLQEVLTANRAADKKLHQKEKAG
jgi:hypothetical protein